MTLTDFNATLSGSFQRNARHALSLRGGRAAAILKRLDSTGADLIEQLQALESASERLRAAYLARWRNQTVKSPGGVAYPLSESQLSGLAVTVTGSVSAREAVGRHDEVVRRISSRSMPLFAGSRLNLFATEKQWVATELAYGAEARDVILAALQKAVLRNAERMSQLIKDEPSRVDQMSRSWALPAGISDDDFSGLARARPGFDRLVLQCGWISGYSATVAAAGPGQGGRLDFQSTALRATPLLFPALLDLDSDGGLITDSERTISSLVLRLLTLLPPGQLRLHVFDRARYGKSVDYLLNIRGEAEKILPGGVGTSGKQLRQTLDDIEGHIGFVTQKYLGGSHATLLDYNRSASDIPEPYRLLVLFGYPDGFERAGGGVDHELIAQLDRIIAAGRACGVFVIIATDSTARGQAPFPQGLPRLFSGQSSMGSWPARTAQFAEPVGSRAMSLSPYSTTAELASSMVRAKAATNFSLAPAAAWLEAGGPVEASTVQSLVGRLENAIAAAAQVRVSASSIARLTGGGGAIVDPSQRATWWKSSSISGLTAVIGRRGAREVQELTLDDSTPHMLAGGRSGAGKSVFLHALITDLTRRYSPNELELYLVDLKFGVEFQAYRGLPHARVVGLQTGKEFAVAVLREINARMQKRAAKFVTVGASQIDKYRELTGRQTSRIVVVIDEFRGYFENDDEFSREAAGLLTELLEKGRAFGIHLVLASQSIVSGFNMPRAAIQAQAPLRVVLRVIEADSRLFLAEDNPQAAHLDRKGQAIFNKEAGRADSNSPFQVTFVTSNEATAQSAALAELARSQSIVRPRRVFDTTRAPVAGSKTARDLRSAASDYSIRIPIGLPFSLATDVTIRLGRSTGGNVLVIAPSDRMNSIAQFAVGTVLSGAVEMEVIDFGGLSSELSVALEPVISRLAAGGGSIRNHLGRAAESTIENLVSTVEDRHATGKYRARQVVVLIANLERAGALKAGSDLADRVETLLRDGPAVGVHLVVFADRLATIDGRLGRYAVDHVDVRVVGALARDASRQLIDSDEADNLPAGRLIVYDRATGARQSVLAFGPPTDRFWSLGG